MFDTDGTWWLIDYDLWDLVDEGYWETKDGRHLKIKKMETNHIENCIKMLERTKEKDEYTDFKLNEFKEELDKREREEIIIWN